MIQIDRSSSVPVQTQLADQLRYEIAGGRFRTGDMITSTRELGRQLGISFHTVRKVYQELEREGYLEARPGAGYIVSERGPVLKEDRMERGAAIANEALKRMLSLGLSDDDIGYLFDEQRALLETGAAAPKVVVAAPYQEMAERCAAQVSSTFQIEAEPSTLREIHGHSDADYVLVPFPDVKRAMHAVPGADVIGISTSLPGDLLDAVSRLSAESSLAIVVRDDDAVQTVMQELRSATAFGGPMVALMINEKPDEMTRRLRDANLMIATPACARRLHGRLPQGQRLYLADQRITEASFERLRSILPH